MPSAPHAKRKTNRPDIRRGSSAVIPARRPSATRLPTAAGLSSTSDRMMWWGWAVAIAFVLAGLVWHVLTFQPAPNRNASRPEAEQLIKCGTLERK